MRWTGKSWSTLGILTIILAASSVASRAQQDAQPDAPSPPGRPPEIPEALPGQAPGGARADIPLPVPVSPPTILHPESQPIDLDTALRLAGVQNPELNVARQRVLESVAMRQLAAARFL